MAVSKNSFTAFIMYFVSFARLSFITSPKKESPHINKLRRLDVETDVPEKEEEKKSARGGIAVVNVNRRIRLLFGEEYGIHVYSKEGIGTDVIVELPLVRDGDRQGGWR